MKYCLIFLLFIYQNVLAQSFLTKVSPKILGKEDVLQVEYIADNVSIDQFNLPPYNNWKLVSGPNISSSKIISGNMVREQTIYSVMLQPQITGVIVIPGASALINNKPQRSNQVTVQVKNIAHIAGSSAAGQQPLPLFDLLPNEVPTSQYLKKGEYAIDKIKNNIFVRLEVSKQKCYVGEPVMATYKLCTRLRSKSKVIMQPSFSGCTVIELTDRFQDQHVEKINGQDYNVFVIRKVQLVPLGAGELTLPPTTVENNVIFYTPGKGGGRDMFGNVTDGQESHVVSMENKPVVLTVEPLPFYNSKATFSGAIGNFNVAIRQAEETFTTNGANHLLMIIEGTGNLQPAKVPTINWPKGIEPFDPSETHETDREQNPVMSRKIFKLPFVADKMGNYILPQVSFTYFDPSSDRYITKTTPSFLFKVLPGNKNKGTRSKESNSIRDFDQRLYILIGASLLIIIIGIAWYNGTRRAKLPPDIKPDEPQILIPDIQLPSPTEEYLYNIRHLHPVENTSTFYKQLGKNLQDYLYAKYSIRPGEIKTFAEHHLTMAVPLQQFKSLLDNCTLGMYTPVFSIEESLQHRLQAIAIIEDLEKI